MSKRSSLLKLFVQLEKIESGVARGVDAYSPELTRNTNADLRDHCSAFSPAFLGWPGRIDLFEHSIDGLAIDKNRKAHDKDEQRCNHWPNEWSKAPREHSRPRSMFLSSLSICCRKLELISLSRAPHRAAPSRTKCPSKSPWSTHFADPPHKSVARNTRSEGGIWKQAGAPVVWILAYELRQLSALTIERRALGLHNAFSDVL